jgi:hypothetical protein
LFGITSIPKASASTGICISAISCDTKLVILKHLSLAWSHFWLIFNGISLIVYYTSLKTTLIYAISVKMYLMHILKSILSLICFAVLGGLSLAIYSGIAVELIYPGIFNSYWRIWWKGWVLIALAWFLYKSKKRPRWTMTNDR